MKKFLGILLSFIMVFSVSSFAGCDNSETQGYIDKIAKLEEQLKNSGADEIVSLKARITELETTVNSLKGIVESTTSGNAALKTQLDSLNTTIIALSEQLTAKDNALLEKITALEALVSDKESGNAALKIKIAELEAKLESGADYDDTELRALITELSADLTASQAEIIELNEKITALETTVGSDNSGLIKQIAELTELVNQTKTMLDTANENIGTMQGQIAKLTTDLAASNTRITLLESLQNGTTEQHIYSVCEDAAEGQPAADNTYTFVNNNTGAKLFSVKLTAYKFYSPTWGLDLSISNHNIPSSVKTDAYFTVYTYNDNTKVFNHYTGDGGFSVEFGQTKTVNFAFLNNPLPSAITHFIIGIPTQDPTKQSIIPYAIFAFSQNS